MPITVPIDDPLTNAARGKGDCIFFEMKCKLYRLQKSETKIERKRERERERERENNPANYLNIYKCIPCLKRTRLACSRGGCAWVGILGTSYFFN